MQPMMPMHIEDLAIAPRAVFDEFGHAGDRCGAGTGDPRHFAVTEAFAELLCDFETLSPGLELTQRTNIAQEVADVFFGLATEECLTNSFEPGFFVVAIFGEAFAGGHREDRNGGIMTELRRH